MSLLKDINIVISILLMSIFLSSCNNSRIYKKINENKVLYTKGKQSSFIEDEKEIINIQDIHNNEVYFDFDQYKINEKFFNLLQIYADFLNKNKLYNVTIEGHADERGTPEYNIILGELRAQAVKDYLKSKGVQDNQIFLVSYGKEKPKVIGHNEYAYSKNRRAVIVY